VNSQLRHNQKRHSQSLSGKENASMLQNFKSKKTPDFFRNPVLFMAKVHEVDTILQKPAM